ncbi:MAG TPA: carbohydrate binding domain-containing protein, partial [Tepidisphaeraceae bacterium]|nr:carbohydrate binding domain-containing protein [Tepidisphaeraceae bacterium]
VSDGQLHLTTQSQDVTDPSGHVFHYTSGLITTANHFAMAGGYIEIRAQIPANSGSGLWPGFWMLGTTAWPPEDDVAEFFTSSNRLHQGLAYGSAAAVRWDDTNSYTPITTGFHTYGMEWGPGYQIFNVDGQITHLTQGSYVPTQPMYLLLNSAVQSGTVSPNTVFPNSFDVDYLRVYRKDGSPYIANGDFEGGALGLWQAQYNAILVSDHTISGNDSLRLQGQGSQASETITGLTANTTYVVTATAEVADGNQGILGVTGFGGADVTDVLNPTTPAPVSVTFTTGRRNTTATVYGRQSSGPGYVWFDNFVIHQAATLQNPGFEAGSLGAWNATASVMPVTGRPHGGVFSLKEDGASASAQQTLYGLLPNTTYRLVGWARVSGADDQAVVSIDDGQSQAAATIISNRWHQAVVLFTTGNSTTATVFCSKPIGSGSAWFDDLRLTIPRIPAKPSK